MRLATALKHPILSSLQTTMEQLHELDEKVFQEYISHKSESLVGIVEPGLHVGFFDWEQCGEPEEVRSYVKDILLNLMLVHAEVHVVHHYGW